MNKKLIMLILISSILLALLLPLRAKNKTYTEYQTKSAGTPTVTREMVIAEIKAQARKYGVSEATSLRIARCESNFSPTAQNKRSSAYGIYQFTNGTWKYIGGGDRNDYKEQIKQFLINYPKHPSWWVCK